MKTLTILLTAALWAVFSWPAATQAERDFIKGPGVPLCAPRDEMYKILARRYREMHEAFGLSTSGGVVELMVSRSESWTLLFTAPNGESCLMAAGEAWSYTAPRRGTGI